MWRTIQGGLRWLQSTVSTTKMKHIYLRQRKVVWMKKSQSKLLKGDIFCVSTVNSARKNQHKKEPSSQTKMWINYDCENCRKKKQTDHSCSQVVKYQHFMSHPSAAHTEGCDKTLIFDDLEMRKGCKKESQMFTVDHCWLKSPKYEKSNSYI